MKELKTFGLIIIILIVVAFITTPQFFVGNALLSLIQILLLLPLLVAAAAMTLVELFLKKVPSVIFQTVIAILLFVVASSIFLFNKEYLVHGLSLPLSFWHRVSFYTLPAIAFESGVITLFSVFIPRSKKLFEREKSYLFNCLGIYAISVMAINFATIAELVTIDTHVLISKGIIAVFIIFALAITTTSLIKKKI